MHSKKQLRELALSARAALGKEQRAAKSAQIAHHLLQWQPLLCARTLCLYASFGTEVRTDGLLAWLLAQQSGSGAITGSVASTGMPAGTRTPTETVAVTDINPEARAADVTSAATGATSVTGVAPATGATSAAGSTVPDGAGLITAATNRWPQVLCLPRVEGDELVIHQIYPQVSRTAVPSRAAAIPFTTVIPPTTATSDAATALPPTGTAYPTDSPHPSGSLSAMPLIPAAGCLGKHAAPAVASPAMSPFGDGGWPELVRSPMGMPEPPASLPVLEPQALEVILVPGSAFCLKTGHRLGYGKGFYDRLLARAPQALKIGLCFDVQLFDMEAFPSDLHDIPLDALVTESGIRDLRGCGA